ncbi:MAG: peptidylprolyl isomerase, partial [Poseidonia sp.]
MHQRGLGVLLVLLFLTPVVGSTTVGVQADEPAWRSVGLDPAEWTDRPDTEDSPMMESYTGNAVISMNVSYQSGWTSAREEGTVIIELFEQWAPITTNNMIAHVESGLYDGVFFHRVINDFVTQSGDPTCKTIGVYPTTSPSCGSGGTGETIPLEHDVNLSHVDGAIGMARSADPDSADSQWYIAETEAHGL